MHIARLLALTLLADAMPLAAQHTPAVTVQVDPSRLPDRSETFDVRMRSDTLERGFGTYRVRVTRGQAFEGRDATLITQLMTLANGAIADSIWVHPVTLVPLAQRSTTPSGTTNLRFEKGRVVGSRMQRSAPAQLVDVKLEQPVLSASIATLIVRCLPLAPAFHTRLALYSDTEGVVAAEVRVLAEETLPLRQAERRVWKVGLKVGDRAATVWIDRDTRQELRTEAALPGGRTMIQSINYN